MATDLREHFKDEKWYATSFFDDERCGLVLDDNTIVLGWAANLNYDAAKKLADEHNATLKS